MLQDVEFYHTTYLIGWFYRLLIAQQALVAIYCDLFDFYFQLRRVLLNRKGKPAGQCVLDVYVDMCQLLTFTQSRQNT